jgi:YidC/Oxa1 family membrane protein insertase
MNIYSFSCILLLLQSNSMVSKAVDGTGQIQPHLTDYTGITGFFGAIFLQIIQALAAFLSAPGLHLEPVAYGLAILLSAVAIRISLLPLTRQQIQGMKAMQMLQPVMKAIQTTYPNKNDQSAKTMELYQKYKINPLAGCLPMLIQLPILFGVYRALYDPSFAGKSFLGIQLLFPVNVSSARNLGQGADLHDVIDVTVAKLQLQHQLWHLPQKLPLLGGAYIYWPALVLVVFYVASSLLMQWKMKQVNAPNHEFERAFKAEMKLKEPPADAAQDFSSQMQKQMGMMNFMIFFFAFIFSAGALLYYIVQNCLMFLEYTFLSRGGQLALDPKELRAFIHQAPPPSWQPPAGAKEEPKALPKVEKGAANGKLDAGAPSGSAQSSEEDGDDGPEGSAASAGLKPRPRKRRKR